MNVRSSARAQRRARVVALWWRANRGEAPDLFERELVEAGAALSRTPYLGRPFGKRGDQTVYRLLLPASEQHLYYVVHPATGVFILALWGARRARPPKL